MCGCLNQFSLTNSLKAAFLPNVANCLSLKLGEYEKLKFGKFRLKIARCLFRKKLKLIECQQKLTSFAVSAGRK